MITSTTNDFYLGRGAEAEWLGSIHLQDCACDALHDIASASTAGEFTTMVTAFLNEAESHHLGTVTYPGDLWPWPWPTSHGTDHVLAFDTDAVWTSMRGQPWFVRPGAFVAPVVDQSAVVFPHGRDSCGFTGIEAADTTSRRYGPLLGDTHNHDLHQLALRILTDLTVPAGPAPLRELAELRARLSPHLRYAITAHEPAVEIQIEVFGYRDGDPAAEATVQALSALPTLYGWADPDGWPPRFGVTVTIADDDRHLTHPVMADRRARAMLTTV
ncbi:hypothetical protein [Sciscionella marina]|uniref:hypothetical protein n=1 Tax=Sciscionella marina TaxID=508770 RepID=UPI00037F1E21|nr:hypothetical protein [Sciscionella marina]